MVTITTNSASVQATGNHPFWVVDGDDLRGRPAAQDVYSHERDLTHNGRWVEARELRIGDQLLSVSGTRISIESLSTAHHHGRVYNMQVDGPHTYAVGPSGVLVHNKPSARILQTGGHTVKPGTAKALNESLGRNLHHRDWGRALEGLKDSLGLPKDYHGRIDALGNYLDEAGNILGNLEDFLH
ncbi:MAG: hypothetical protein GX621_12655 [Pirellulaceae bacterium]|nr:hypothetical protein [Pirellulaceae bacterium]